MTIAKTAKPLPAGTSLRVFVSSVFRDMQDERDELVRRVSPQLEALCAERGLHCSLIDLRWGITNERRAEGKVLPICFAEIDRCRPYFIGILGGQYGSIPESIPEDMVREHPWLRSCRDRSVTELEILYGALQAKNHQSQQAVFYYRTKHGNPVASHDSGSEDVRLTDLKQRIVKEGFPVRQFGNARELGALVLRDLTSMFKLGSPDRPRSAEPRDIPDRDVYRYQRVLFMGDGVMHLRSRPLTNSQYDFSDNEREVQRHIASTLRTLYLPHPQDLQALDEHVSRSRAPLIVTGATGAGKSALLAHWTSSVAARAASGPDGTRAGSHGGPFSSSAVAPPEVIAYHVDGRNTRRHWAGVLRYLLEEMKARLEIADETPSHPEDLQEAVREWPAKIGATRRVVLVIDGIDQLDYMENIYLTWLPDSFPAGVQVIASAGPGAQLSLLQRRGWRSIEVQPLGLDRKRKWIDTYLVRYGKELPRHLVEQLASFVSCANPRFLITLLEELRICGDSESLSRRLAMLLAFSTHAELLNEILGRFETDFAEDHPHLVRDAFAAILATEKGLSDSELRDILGSDGNPLPSAFLSPLLLAADSWLREESGKLRFRTSQHAECVRARYLHSDADRMVHHHRLATWASRSRSDSRVADLLWQLAQLRNGKELAARLSDLQVLARIWKHSELSVHWYWARALEYGGSDPVAAYAAVIEHPTDHVDVASIVHTILSKTGYEAAATLLDSRRHRSQDEPSEIPRILKHVDPVDTHALADRFYRYGGHAEALALYELTERQARAVKDQPCSALALRSQADALVLLDKLAEACKRYARARWILSEAGEIFLAQQVLIAEADALTISGDSMNVALCLDAAEAACRRYGYLGLLVSVLERRLRGQDAQHGEQTLALTEEIERTVKALASVPRS